MLSKTTTHVVVVRELLWIQLSAKSIGFSFTVVEKAARFSSMYFPVRTYFSFLFRPQCTPCRVALDVENNNVRGWCTQAFVERIVGEKQLAWLEEAMNKLTTRFSSRLPGLQLRVSHKYTYMFLVRRLCPTP